MNRSSHFEEIFLVTAVRFATTHALSAIQARTQRNSFNDPQQMRIGISLPVGEYQSIARTPFVTSRQPLGKLVIDADVALFAILHLPVITFPLAIDLDFFGPQIDVGHSTCAPSPFRKLTRGKIPAHPSHLHPQIAVGVPALRGHRRPLSSPHR